MEAFLSPLTDYRTLRAQAQEGALDRLKRLSGHVPPAVDDELKYYCEELESLFIYLLLKEMRKTVPETKLFHGGRAEEIFRDLHDEELARQLAHARGGGIGIADMLYRQLSRPASAAPAPDTAG
ncbi:MAG: rod-binding protein [bacterium]